MSFLLFILTTIGMTNILVHGAILDIIVIFKKTIREWLTCTSWSKILFECYECSGFWCGMISSYLLLSEEWKIVVCCGFIGSVVSQLYTNITYHIFNFKEFEISKDEDGIK